MKEENLFAVFLNQFQWNNQARETCFRAVCTKPAKNFLARCGENIDRFRTRKYTFRMAAFQAKISGTLVTARPPPPRARGANELST